MVSESFAGRLTAFDIENDGSLSGRRVWAEGLGSDGICIDAEGGIWVQTADTFAHTGDPNALAGACVRVLETPGPPPGTVLPRGATWSTPPSRASTTNC